MTREEAIKWIDDRMCFGRGTFTEHHPPNIDECWQAGMMAIEALQADLVLCKDCKYRDPEDERCDHGAVNFLLRRTDDDYCSYGERKGGDSE